MSACKEESRSYNTPYLCGFAGVVLSCLLQAAAIPPTEWLWRNVYVQPDHMDMRTVQGTYVQPAYDPTYSS
jgi:hypothetical protein